MATVAELVRGGDAHMKFVDYHQSYKDGNKEYYQRDFCWTIKDKQLLIDSIYNQINCGQILVRKRSWQHMKEEVENGLDEVL